MKRSPTILLVNGWHDDNKGDSAIAEATIRELRRRWPSSRIGLVSLLHEGHPAFADAYRHLANVAPDLQVHPSPVPKLTSHPRGGFVAGALEVAAHLPGSLLDLAWPGRRSARIEPYRTADLVVAIGGHDAYCEAWSPRGWLRLYRVMFPLWMAQRTGTPYVVAGQSLGPFGDPVARGAVARLLSRAQRLVVREGLSLALARDLGVPEDRLVEAPDMAFALRPTPTARVTGILERHGLSNDPFWVVTVRSAYVRSGRSQQTAAFLEDMRQLVIGALERTGRVAIVAHSLGPVATEDDRIPSRELHASLGGNPRVELIEDDLSPGELAALYGEAELVVGTRFHSVILALIAGTPSFAISYFGPKTRGIMQALDMADLCADMDGLDPHAALAAIDARDPATLRRHIATRVASMQDDIRRVFDQLEPASE